MAMAITVPDRSLKTSWLRIRAGPLPRLLTTVCGIQVGPTNVAPQYAGHSVTPSDSLSAVEHNVVSSTL